MKSIAIIGGGAAGLMTVATLIESNIDAEIHLFEKNDKLGIKVSLSGGGRCNVTTGINDRRTLLSNYIRGDKFLRPAMAAFPPSKVREWFEDKGLVLKEQDDKRVFPASDNGNDVIAVFLKLFKNHRLHIHSKEGVLDVEFDDQFRIKTEKEKYTFDSVVITTGGNAYRKTGSTGDGYGFARKLGHTVTPLGPSLNSFFAEQAWCKENSGISFPNAKLRTTLSSGEQKQESGPVLLTHFGISGPAVFALAAHAAFEPITPKNPLEVFLIPDKSFQFDTLDKELQSRFMQDGGKLPHNIISDWFPERFVKAVISLTGVGSKKSADTTRTERQQIVRYLTEGLPLTITARRPGDEFVSAGGVSLDEINPKTMESRLLDNLYFAGEILNVDGLTGGFNLQSAWATGRLAGRGILLKSESLY
ncbi:aminoacetone oxidase family FAD-binding enzyme [Candidatus Dojkabacteria bacterium]|uniref:Aminoacetone oxidase family FAD-binding enzyme n=1 Tax=Candidatus Dojkabacteria bacterium TaxID=2099670 RepID=A0A955L7E6_9BACT|nr:aminoacetone oxidase family FAD-binding enzyme [Candidatus Dojkabacteria bacterium]